MAYVSPQATEQARHTDVLTWLQQNEPGNLVKVSSNCYCTKEHDSLKISNGKWHWFSRGIGGKSALDYLIRVKDYGFLQAVEAITGGATFRAPSFSYVPQKEEPKKLLMPELERNPSQAKKYLEGRGIHHVVVDYCISHSLIFETANYHNVVFVGYDMDGVPRYGAMRSTTTLYKGDVTGSDKHFSFSIMENPNATEIPLFEAAIDLLSYATMELYKGVDWKQEYLLSLAGVYKTKRKGVVPVALAQFLKDHPKINTIHLHLDNDEVGRGAAAGIIEGLRDKYTVIDEPPLQGKDINEELVHMVGLKKKKECYER